MFHFGPGRRVGADPGAGHGGGLGGIAGNFRPVFTNELHGLASNVLSPSAAVNFGQQTSYDRVAGPNGVGHFNGGGVYFEGVPIEVHNQPIRAAGDYLDGGFGVVEEFLFFVGKLEQVDGG